MADTWEYTDDPSDPCSYCVQFRCALCKQDLCPEDCPGYPQSEEWEPYWPDGSVVPRVYGGIHNRCAEMLAQYEEDVRRDPT